LGEVLFVEIIVQYCAMRYVWTVLIDCQAMETVGIVVAIIVVKNSDSSMIIQ